MFVFYWFILLRLWLQDFIFATLITPPSSFLPLKEELSSFWSLYSEVRSMCTWLESFSIWNLHAMLFKVIPLFFFKYKVSKQSLNAYTMICVFFFSLVNLSTFQKQSTRNLRQGLLHLRVFIKLHVSYLKGNFCIWKVLLEQLILRNS